MQFLPRPGSRFRRKSTAGTGSFLLNWIWGIGNGTPIALLTLIPFVGFVMIFVLGAKGSAWAWRNGRWDSVEHFRRVQRKWAFWGIVVWLAWIGLPVAGVGSAFYALRSPTPTASGRPSCRPIRRPGRGARNSTGFDSEFSRHGAARPR